MINESKVLKGNNVAIRSIDTAMMLLDYNLCKDIRWIPDLYIADGFYLEECYHQNIDKHVYVNNELCYWNYIIPN